MIRVGLNGFGRIGRAVTRLADSREDLKLVAVNDLDPDLSNHAYLLKYDSIYGRFGRPVEVVPGEPGLLIDGTLVRFFCDGDVRNLPWEEMQLDVLIEATGVDANVVGTHQLVARGVPKVVVTNANPAVDTTIIFGVNETSYDEEKHHVISSSICDSNAIAPILFELGNRWGVESCQITTLHPWLSYQNLLDGTVASVSNPSHYWDDYGLGRASVLNLIPKDTTAGRATLVVLPSLEGKIAASSFRTPTHIVSATDICVLLREAASAEEVNEHFLECARVSPKIFGFEQDHLVSMDYCGVPQSLTVDGRRTTVANGRLLKMVAWYDNEWGYSSRVLDTVALAARGLT